MSRPRTSCEVPKKETVFTELGRILSSASLRDSPSLVRFLRHIVEEKLASRDGRITQYTIATQVFGRKDDFNPSVDPIVRVQAGRLRKALENYYLREGAEDRIRIVIPRGTYRPEFRIAPDATVDPRPERTAAPEPADGLGDAHAWPSLAVLAFENRSGIAEHAYLSSGIAVALACELRRYPELRVFPCLPGCDFDERDLPARFALRGEIHQDGTSDVPLVNAYLVDRTSHELLWSERYRGGANSDSLPTFLQEVSEVIAARIAEEHGVLNLNILPESLRHPPSRGTVHDAVLRYYNYESVYSTEAFADAFTALEGAVRVEPECGLAHAMLARLYATIYGLDIQVEEITPEEALEKAHSLVGRAVTLEPMDRRARTIKSYVHLLSGHLEAGRRDAVLALRLDPGSLCFLDGIGYVMTLLGGWKRGTTLIRQALRRNPCCRPVAFYALWLDAMRRNDYQKAYDEALQCRGVQTFWSPLTRAAALGSLGRKREAASAAKELLARRPDFPERHRQLIRRYVKFEKLVDRIAEGLRGAGIACD